MARYSLPFTVHIDVDSEHAARAVADQISACVFNLPDVMAVAGHPPVDITESEEADLLWLAP
jgi:hypothetical protein